MQPIPLCPITGLPAARRIQLVSGRLIIGLWRGAFGVSTERQLAGIEHFGLWKSPCGLTFFKPMLAGDEAFYRELHRRWEFRRVLAAPGLTRSEFKHVAEIIQPGEKVLNVGCAEGGLARHLPHATYVGLDPIFRQRRQGRTFGTKLPRSMPESMTPPACSMSSSMSPIRQGLLRI